jgi:hypothetical protein
MSSAISILNIKDHVCAPIRAIAASAAAESPISRIVGTGSTSSSSCGLSASGAAIDAFADTPLPTTPAAQSCIVIGAEFGIVPDTFTSRRCGGCSIRRGSCRFLSFFCSAVKYCDDEAGAGCGACTRAESSRCQVSFWLYSARHCSIISAKETEARTAAWTSRKRSALDSTSLCTCSSRVEE